MAPTSTCGVSSACLFWGGKTNGFNPLLPLLWAAQRAVPPPGAAGQRSSLILALHIRSEPPLARWSQAAHTHADTPLPGSLPHTVHQGSSAGSSPPEVPRYPWIFNSCLKLLQIHFSQETRGNWKEEAVLQASPELLRAITVG